MSRRLYSLLVEEHHLPDELILLKSLFLLGSGELFRALLDALEPVLASRPGLLVALLTTSQSVSASSSASASTSASAPGAAPGSWRERESALAMAKTSASGTAQAQLSQAQAATAALALHTELKQCFRYAINCVGPSAFASSLPGKFHMPHLLPHRLQSHLLFIHFCTFRWQDTHRRRALRHARR